MKKVIGAALLALGSLTACGAPAAPAPEKATVTYEVVATGKASNVTYTTDGAGSTSQEASVVMPWRKDVTVDRGFAIASLTAQNAGRGELTCRISVDGAVVKEATSSGQYAVVSCTSESIT
jgi:Mycobacterium membrane protein